MKNGFILKLEYTHGLIFLQKKGKKKSPGMIQGIW